MPKRATEDAADYILPLNINGLQGRMLRMSPPKGKRKEILFVYGHHSSVDRWVGIAEYLNKYGGVTIPDLPGFGGMDPLYKIGQKPSLDTLADYLASFIKLRYKNRKFNLVGLSLGFMVVTRMLQKYPQLTNQVDNLVSFAGFTNKDDFKYKARTYWTFRCMTWLLSHKTPALFLKYFVFRAPFIRLGYKVFEPIFVSGDNTKIRGAETEEELKKRIDFEVYLWQCNDIRTYMDVAHTMLTLNLRGRHVDAMVHHMAIDEDRYFDNVRVEEHMREIYKEFDLINAKVPAHSPSVIAEAKEAKPFIKPLAHLLRNKR